tara:strand:+ start:1139 stop:4543 length:3405 start_codon:yes stop_codon:yes gene_type:complete
MNKRETPKIKFVNLHTHSTFSVFDGFGFPDASMNYAYENGMDALALTDHGSCNGLSYQVLHAKKMAKNGKKFKPIFGIEAYYHPSIEEWTEDYEEWKANKKGKKKGEAIDGGVFVEDEKRAVKGKINRRRHLVLLAMNQKGLNNLFQLVSESFAPGNFYKFPRIDRVMLEKYGEGLIALSACLGGVYAEDYWKHHEDGDDAVMAAMRKTTSSMQEIFGDRWYAEIQWNRIPEQHELNQYIIRIAEEMGVELVSTSDAHYPTPDSWKDKILYKKLGWLNKKTDEDNSLPESVEELDWELYPKNGDQMWEAYEKYSEGAEQSYDDGVILASIERAYDIAENRIEAFMPDATVRLPDFVVPEGETADAALHRMCFESLETKGLHEKQEYVDRLERELSVIAERGFSKYFLTMKAISDRAVESQLVGPGRGSAAGALMSYVLDITQVDPLKYGLLFERFLTKGGDGYPDIDYDVADPMTLKEVLIDEWGENNVVPISNWNTLGLRSLIKDISKFYGIPFTEVNTVTGKMLSEAKAGVKKERDETAGAMLNPTFEEIKKHSTSLRSFLNKHPKVKEHIDALHGQIRSVSRHAGGIVVAEDLHKSMPLIVSGGVRQTPWSEGQNVRHLEPLGFVKFDILGLKTLRMLDIAIRHILKRHFGVQEPTFYDVRAFYDAYLHPDVIDTDDQDVYENVYHKGRWAGNFQFTEDGAQNFCQSVKPTNIIDVTAITSTYRPGPMGAKVHKKYAKAKNDPDSVTYLNDKVRAITEETSGFLIFQEQIAMLAHELGKDVDLDEGNMLRKVLTKKGTAKEAMKNKIHKKFMAGELPKDEADALWQTFEYFSGYGFNKSHALCYSFISFQCAWLFHYYPIEWLAAFVENASEKKKEQAISTVKGFGYNVRGLDVNSSGRVWGISADGKTLIQPLTSVKGMGESAIDQVLNNRPFNTIEDFLFNENIVYSKLNKSKLDALIRSQAMNGLMDDRFVGLKHFWSAVAVDRPKTVKKFHENIELYSPEGDFTKEEKIEYLVTLTGVFPMDQVVSDKVLSDLRRLKVPPLGNFDKGLKVAWFIPREVIEKKTRYGKLWWLVRAIDSTNTVTTIKCWGVRPGIDHIHLNAVYMARLDYDEQWGFSSKSIRKNFKLLT